MGPAGAGRRGTRYKQEVEDVEAQAWAGQGSAGGQAAAVQSWAPSLPSFPFPSSPPRGPSSAPEMCEVRGHPTPSLVPE